jgi:hypothetical protein
VRIVRPVVCLALAVSLTAAGAAGAATRPKPKPVKPVCNLVVDPAGDATVGVAPADDALDIVSADVASDAKSFTAVIRVADAAAVQQSQLGSEVQITFELAGAVAPVFIQYNNSAYGGKAFQYGVIGQGDAGSTSPTGDAIGVVDTAKNEIRMTVATSAINEFGKAKPGAKVSNLTVATAQLVGIAPNPTGVYAYNSLAVDDATGSKAYIAGYPSCVKPGA